MSDCKSCPYAERLRGAVNALIREANKRDPDWTPAIRDARTALASDPAQGAGKDQSRSALPHPQGGEVASVGERAIPEAKGGSQSAQSVPLLDRNPCPDASATLMPTGAYATIQRNPQAPSTVLSTLDVGGAADLLLDLLKNNPWPSSDPRWQWLEAWADRARRAISTEPSTGGANG
jgi:hypothetical protein